VGRGARSQEVGVGLVLKRFQPVGLALDQEPVREQGRLHLGVVTLEGVDLLASAVELASETEQLEQEQPPPLIGGVALDLLHLGLDGLGQLPALNNSLPFIATSARLGPGLGRQQFGPPVFGLLS